MNTEEQDVHAPSGSGNDLMHHDLKHHALEHHILDGNVSNPELEVSLGHTLIVVASALIVVLLLGRIL